jgi:hypothetical protein
MNLLLSGDFSEFTRGHLMTGRVFFFMAGLAVENLVKALPVHRGLAKVERPTLPGDLKGHGIQHKLRRLKIVLSPEEAKMVHKFEIAVSWAGRYPVPLDADRMPAGSGTITQVKDVSDFLKLYNRLDVLLAEHGPKGSGR